MSLTSSAARVVILAAWMIPAACRLAQLTLCGMRSNMNDTNDTGRCSCSNWGITDGGSGSSSMYSSKTECSKRSKSSRSDILKRLRMYVYARVCKVVDVSFVNLYSRVRELALRPNYVNLVVPRERRVRGRISVKRHYTMRSPYVRRRSGRSIPHSDLARLMTP
jgi:hypothetical protein